MNAKTKASHQSLLETHEIDVNCFEGQWLTKTDKPAKNLEKSKLSQNLFTNTNC